MNSLLARFDGTVASFIRLALTILISFSTCYTFGYLHALGRDAYIFLDSGAIVSLLFQAALSLSFACVSLFLVTRFSDNDTDRDLSLPQVIASRPFAWLPVSLMFVSFVNWMLAPGFLLKNMWFPLLLLSLFYFSFALYGQRRTGLIEFVSRCRIARKGKAEIFKRMWKRNLSKFLISHSFVIVFAVASWAGYSRAEFMMQQWSVLKNFDRDVSSKVAPVLFQKSAVIFIDEDGRFVRVADASFMLLNEKTE